MIIIHGTRFPSAARLFLVQARTLRSCIVSSETIRRTQFLPSTEAGGRVFDGPDPVAEASSDWLPGPQGGEAAEGFLRGCWGALVRTGGHSSFSLTRTRPLLQALELFCQGTDVPLGSAQLRVPRVPIHQFSRPVMQALVALCSEGPPGGLRWSCRTMRQSGGRRRGGGRGTGPFLPGARRPLWEGGWAAAWPRQASWVGRGLPWM